MSVIAAAVTNFFVAGDTAACCADGWVAGAGLCACSGAVSAISATARTSFLMMELLGQGLPAIGRGALTAKSVRAPPSSFRAKFPSIREFHACSREGPAELDRD